MSQMRSAHPEPASAISVRVIAYDLLKLRLVQVLGPIALIVFPLARRLGSTAALVPAVLVGAVAIGTFVSARKSQIARLVAHAGYIKVGSRTIQAGEAGRWRWHGKHATLFAPQGNVVLRPRAPTDPQALRTALEGALGAPLPFRRRGSPRARIISLLVAALGLVVLGIGIAHNLVYLMPAIIPLIVGLATFAALSGRVADTSPNQRG